MTEAGTLPHSSPARPGPFAVWLQAIRPFSLTAAVIPVLIGTAVAGRAGFFSAPRLVLALIGAMAIQAGTNLINDYYDYLSGTDSPQTLGPSQVIQRGLLAPAQVWRGGVGALGLGAALGLVLVYLCGWPILVIGVLSVLAGYFYTARPVALAYIAMGELTVFVFMGPVIVMGAYYVMALGFSWAAFAASIPVGFLVAGILHANNIRDIDNDRAHGKLTLAALLGRRAANRELAALDLLAYATVLAGVLVHALPWLTLIVFATVPRALDQLRISFREHEPKKLNAALMRAVQLHMEFGLLLIIAFVAAMLLRW